MRRSAQHRRLLAYLASAALLTPLPGRAQPVGDDAGENDPKTATPVKHVVVIYGENRSFDHLFATYAPGPGQTVRNLLSEGIVTRGGRPGPNFAKARQFQASDTKRYDLSPPRTGPYKVLPPPNTSFTSQAASDTSPPPFKTKAVAAKYDYGLLPSDIGLLTTGASGLPPLSIDTRIDNVRHLPPGPFQLTHGMPYDAYAASPVHRYYQGRQQADCSAAAATDRDPSGCRDDLYPWVEVTVGAGSNGQPQPAGFDDETTHEGATAMGFDNVAQGDQPYFDKLAHEYAMSDNYHQPGWGGTGLNSILAGFADGLWYSDGKGHAARPPRHEIENPDPQPGTDNWYEEDGYGASGGTGGGSYSECADAGQPGVRAVDAYLEALQPSIRTNCEPGHFYLLNNYNPGYFGNGSVDTTDTFTIPPVPTRSIGNVLLENKVSFHWYGEGWNRYAKNPQDPTDVYCTICNPFQYQTSIMADAALRDKVNKDTRDFYDDVAHDTLPAVSFVKPSGLNDGHPQSSKWSIFQAFTRQILTELQAHPTCGVDRRPHHHRRGGGYYARATSRPSTSSATGRASRCSWSRPTRRAALSHSYGDHVSILNSSRPMEPPPTISDRAATG